MQVRHLEELLKSPAGHNAWPVEDGQGRFIGMITRGSCEVVLKAQRALFQLRQFRSDAGLAPQRAEVASAGLLLEANGNEASAAVQRIAKSFSSKLLGKVASSKMTVDLRQYIDGQPYTCRPEAAVFRIHKLFTLLGLRHIPVVDHGRVVGMVTRKDLLPWVLEGVTPSKRRSSVLEPGRHPGSFRCDSDDAETMAASVAAGGGGGANDGSCRLSAKPAQPCPGDVHAPSSEAAAPAPAADGVERVPSSELLGDADEARRFSLSNPLAA